MRGQISLEYLVLSLVALSLLSLAVFALISLRDYSATASGAFAFRSSALSLSNAISETCALGSGNIRSVFLKTQLSVDYQEQMMRFTGGNLSIAQPSRCEVVASDDLEGLVYVENEGGVIAISK